MYTSKDNITRGKCSFGTTNATNVTIHTTGNSSAAIRSDRGGGTVTVTNSYATTTGTGSPAIYSTADITVEDSYLSSDGSQGVVVEGSDGQIYVEIESGSTWKLTGDSYVTSLSCDADAIDLNGYTLYVNGVEYEEGSTSSGEAIEIEVKESQKNSGEAPDGKMPGGEKPEGEAPSGGKPSKKN